MRTVKALIAIAAVACSALAHSQDYPARPITFVVPLPAGGAGDVMARTMADEMSKNLKQAIVIDNKPGASGMLGSQIVARAQPDGYTVLVTHATPIYYMRHLSLKVPYDVKRDFAFVTEIGAVTQVFAVAKDVPARTMQEFIAWAQTQKGKVNYGSFGIGSSVHLAMAYLDNSRKLEMTHIAYSGGAPMVQAMVAGQVHVALGSLGDMAAHITSGSLRPLAITGDTRLPELPNVPTLAEAGFPDPELQPFGGMMVLAPAKTPPAILARLEKEARAAIQTPVMKARILAAGFSVLGNSSAEFGKNFDISGPIIQRQVQISGAKVD